MQQVKAVVVGDGGIGKTCFIITSQSGSYPGDSEWRPNVADSYPQNMMIDGAPFAVALWDTQSQEDYDRLRPLSYPNTDIFLICFAVNQRYTFDDIRTRWIPELQHHAPGVRFMLCGLKSDLRNELNADTNSDFVSIEEAHSLRAELGALEYIEVSSKDGVNVQLCVENAARHVASHREERNRIPDRNDGAGCCRRCTGIICFCCSGLFGMCRVPKCTLEEAVNQSFQCIAFLVVTSLYIAVDVGALIVAQTQHNTKIECWNEFDSLWLDPATFLTVGALSSLIGLALGMCFKTLCGVDELAQDGPRLCLLLFFMTWSIMGYVLAADIGQIAECDQQAIGKMIIAWSVVKMVESCCASLDIVINAVMFLGAR